MASQPAKRPRITQKFREEYSRMWSFIVPSQTGEEYARCKVCETDVKIASGGRSDLERHIKTPKHASRAKSASSTPSISSMFSNAKTASTQEQNVLKAEILFTQFIVEHNLPIAIADHAGELFRKMFPDSNIAQKFKCGRTKARQLVKRVAESSKEEIVGQLKRSPFSIATDGSNDRGSEQIYPVVVRYHNEERVVTDVLSVTTPNGPSTGENIFKALDTELSNHGLKWENCISFGSDNASVMMGKHNGVAAHVLNKNPNIHIQECPCHLLHIAAKKASQSLRCPLEDILIDIFHYLDNSTKRLKALESFQQETGCVVRKIIKHGPTRWLSLHRCVERLIEQWDALVGFFSQEKENAKNPTPRLARIVDFLHKSSSKAYAYFLQYALPIYIRANLLLQREEPTIHLMRQRLHEVVTDLLVAFVKPSAITNCSDIYKIEHSRRSKQKDREELMIGDATREYLNSKAMSNTETTHFYEDARLFYSTSLSYIFSNLPLQEEALCHAEVLDVSKRVKNTPASIRYWAQRFPCLVPAAGLECLERQFAKFQIDPLDTLDSNAFQKRVDELWVEIGEIKDDTGVPKYNELVYFMKGLCALPHSNADAERVFSLVRKNKTEARSSMSRDLLCDLLLMKMKMLSREECCYKCIPSPSMLAKVNMKQ